MSDTGKHETFAYDDDITRKFLLATMVWGVVGMLVGLVLALMLAVPELNLPPLISFGRLRPLHTNAVIFAFAGNAVFLAIYYTTQRLLKARMFSDTLSRIHFWGWQLIIVAAAVTLPLGITSGKEYAELEWPIDIAIAAVWVVFAVNFFGTLARRREKHLYVALWFYIATVITVAVLHIFNSLAVPVTLWKSYSIYAGVQDAFMQWWYGHNAVAFVLTTPFLGLMYYFMPKAAERPVFSYRLSILHFWSLVFIYIWAGPHHLQYTALPSWAASLGMIFSVMLWMPSWGGMVNGLLTLRGAWKKVAEDPVLKFFVVGVTFYGMSTFEGPLMSVKSVNALSHYTDWTIGHAHGGALGWVGFMTFGMIYWLAPRLFQTELWSQKAATIHFWIATIGIILYVIAMWVAGITQGLMWRAFDETGRLQYPDFIETVTRLVPMYWVRALGGLLYLAGGILGLVNILATWAHRPSAYALATASAPPLDRSTPDHQPGHEPRWKGLWAIFKVARIHRRWEGLPLTFSVLCAVAVVVASLFELLPAFLLPGNVPTIAAVKPYTPLELMGRELYIREGCYNCHSQMVRPFLEETVRYGDYSKPGEFIYDHPFQWGSRRIGPDLHREGGRRSDLWHVHHFRDPRATSKGSIMPRYPHFFDNDIDFDGVQKRVDVMAMLGAPYDKAALGSGAEVARKQADAVAAAIVKEGGSRDVAGKEVVAVIAYLQRLGTDITVVAQAPPPAPPPSPPTAAPPSGAAPTPTTPPAPAGPTAPSVPVPPAGPAGAGGAP